MWSPIGEGVFSSLFFFSASESLRIILPSHPRRSKSHLFIGSFVFGDVSVSQWRTAVILITSLVMVLCWLLLTRTRFGLQMRASLENAALARSSGISVDRVYATTFAFGSGLAGLAGGLMVPMYSISADMGVPFLIKSFLAVMLGGMGSFEGSIAGAALVGATSAA